MVTKKKRTRAKKVRPRLRRLREKIAARRWWILNATGILVIVLLFYIAYLDGVIRFEFEGKRWALPARVYARPLELYPGLTLAPAAFRQELELLRYQEANGVSRPGSFWQSGNQFFVTTRPFQYADGEEASTAIQVGFSGEQITSVVRKSDGQQLDLVRLDPVQFASITPAHNEDRVLIQAQDVPPLLLKGLVAVEDRRFYSHIGLDFRGLARAVWVNLRAGHIVQGGSTLTQQLVKNFFLTGSRTLGRKVKEAMMSVLLEVHYPKDEILIAYCNEVFLGQDGKRAIHGFGLGSDFYFGAAPKDLRLPEIALLVGMIQGPSYYDPRRHPERALQRRNQVLSVMAEQKLISASEAEKAKQAPLGVTPVPRASSRFPAVVDLVRRQLHTDYKEEDLRSQGLRVFTSLDPLVQLVAEDSLSRQIAAIEPQSKDPESALQGAMIVTNPNNGEVLAVVGDRNPRAAGFNRALLAERHVGSIMKPVVFLAALESGNFSLASLLDDSELSVEGDQGEIWQPQNYDNEYHGTVPLFYALSHSYNIATVRLGLAVGVPNVINTLRQLGVDRPINPFPSMLLGATDLTPFEVTQMYQILAAQGFKTPLRAIRAVLSSEGQPLQRYSLEVKQTVPSVPVFLLNSALQEVFRDGTAKGALNKLPESLSLAGKTGTSNDLHDSWFAGFSGDKLAVVWLGRDNNTPAGLTGASGALRVWTDAMSRMAPQPLEMAPPTNVEWYWVDRETGGTSGEGCEGAVLLPFAQGTQPETAGPCGSGLRIDRAVDWFKRMLKP